MTLTQPLRLMVAFALHGIVVGLLYARLPEIQRGLALSEVGYGMVLMALPLGVILGNILVARLIERAGPRRMLLVGLPVFAALPVLPALAPTAPLLGGAVFLFGGGLAVGNLAINMEADRYEAATDRRIMGRCHGAWGVGFLLVTLVSVGVIRLGIAPAAQFVAAAVILALVTRPLLSGLSEYPPRPGAPARGRRFALPGRATLLVSAFALAGVIMEGTTRSWSVIYLRDMLGATDAIAALALPAFVLTQTLGRFLGDGRIARFGAVAVGRASAVMLFLGMVLVIFATGPVSALAGFALIGLGVSVAVPLGFSAAARAGDRPVAENMAAFAMLSTMMNTVGPPLFGAVAGAADLRIAMVLFLPLALVAYGGARFLAPRA